MSATATITWKQQGRCLGVDPEVFYPDEEDEHGAELAKQICYSCPVREVCLEHAIGVREKWGIWGGLTARERRRIIRRRRRSA
jgi:WhiB family transcriptional regulator, redox-sensing transcriptional regulator